MGYNMSRTSLYMDKEKHEELKSYCADHGMTVNGLIKVLIDRYMREVKATKESRYVK